MWYIIFFLNFFLLPQLIFCQSNSFQKITVADGLSNNFVRSIHKDQFGFIWFGTLDGLDRYDGVEIRSFSDRFPDGHQRVNSILDGPGKGLWIGTDKGLLFWDFISDDFKLVPVSESTVNVTTLLELPGDSLLLTGTSKGIFLINTKTFKKSKLNVNVTDPFIPSKAVYDGINRVWISTSTCLIELSLDDFDTAVHYNGQTESANSNFSTLTMFNDNIILGTMTRGLFLFDVNKREFTPYKNIGTNFILAAQFSPQGKLYIGTDGNGFIEVNTFDGTVRSFVQDVTNPYTLNSNAVYSLLVENNGRFWLGTYSGGVNYTSTANNLFFGFNSKDFNLGENSIRSIYFDDADNKFIGTREGLYVIEQSGKSQLFNIKNSEYLRSNIILSFAAFEDDVLVGTFRGGLSKYSRNKGVLENYLDVGVFLDGSIYQIARDKDENLLIADMSGLIIVYAETGLVRQYSVNNSPLVDNRLISLFYDSKERLWVGSVEGGTSVYAIKGDELVRLEIEFDLSDYKAVSFFEDHRGDIWIATEGNGLSVIGGDLDRIIHYTTQDGLSNNSVTSITEAPENTFWISTLRGLSRFDKASNRFFSYSLSDGLPSLVFNRGAVVNNYESDGKLWFGSERGLISFYPDSLLNQGTLEKVVLTDFYLSGQVVEPDPNSFLNLPVYMMSKIKVKAGQSSIGFRFLALNYYNPGDNEYAYRLKGRQEEWSFTNDNYVTFSGLKPGRYTFEVALSQGIFTDFPEATSVDVIVKPLFYHQTSFQVIILLLIVSSIIGIILFGRRLKLIARIRKVKEQRYQSSHLSSTRKNEIESKLISYVENNKPYLNPDLKLNDLANAIDCTPHHVSQVINQNLKISYYEFINHYRIIAVKKCMADPIYSKYTLLAIGQQCGFSSKTSFYRAFKKLTGQTPYDYQVQTHKNRDKV